MHASAPSNRESSVPSSVAAHAAAKVSDTAAAAGVRAPKRKELSGVVLTLMALMCTMLWAGAQIGVKFGLSSAPPFVLMGIRFMLASLLLVPVAFYVKSPWPATRGAWLRTLSLGVLNNTLYLGLTAAGLQHVSAGLACVLAGINPLGLALGGFLFFRERISRQEILGLLGALCGVMWVMNARLGSDNSLSGAMTIILANGVMVAGNLCYKRWQNDCGLLVSHLVQLAVGGVSLLALSANTENWNSISWDSNFWIAQAFLVFGVSFGAMLTWLFLLSRGSASKAGAFLFLVPLFGLAEGAVILHESLSRTDLLGAALTTGCIYIAQKGQAGGR